MKENITESSGNVFVDLGYPPEEAAILQMRSDLMADGFLTAAEIFNMNMNADIVGLSACKTGLGVQSAGEGVVGLSRAFMYAGTDTVLVSLWSVSDESTYKLMVNFFDGLKRGKDKLTALKDAIVLSCQTRYGIRKVFEITGFRPTPE